MSKKDKKDPFLITKEDAGDIKKGVARGTSGILCPKENKDIGGECAVCDYMQTAIYPKKYPDEHPARVWSRSRKAKLNWFMNVVFPSNPDKSVILEVGSKAGNVIVNGTENLGWTDIAHPHKDKGREMICTKSKGEGGHPTYAMNAHTQKADWEIPEEVWKNVPDLKDIIGMIERGELTEKNHMRISTMKMDENLTFRICPPLDLISGRRWTIVPVFRHWGVTQSQIDGESSISWKDSEEDDEDIDTTENPFLAVPEDEPKDEKEEKKKEKKEEEPNCFGMDKFYDEDDEDCVKDCDWFKKCGKKIAKG